MCARENVLLSHEVGKCLKYFTEPTFGHAKTGLCGGSFCSKAETVIAVCQWYGPEWRRPSGKHATTQISMQGIQLFECTLQPPPTPLVIQKLTKAIAYDLQNKNSMYIIFLYYVYFNRTIHENYNSYLHISYILCSRSKQIQWTWWWDLHIQPKDPPIRNFRQWGSICCL